jgi:hypothetical protein
LVLVQGREAGHSPPYSAEVKNGGAICTPTLIKQMENFTYPCPCLINSNHTPQSSFLYPLRDQGFYTYNFLRGEDEKIYSKSNTSCSDSVIRPIHRLDDGDMMMIMMMATVKVMIKVV